MHLGGLAEFGARRSGIPPDPSANIAAAVHLVRMMDARGIAKALVVTVPGKRPGGLTGVGDQSFIRNAVKAHAGRLYLMDGGATLKPIIEATPVSAVTEKVRADFTTRAEALLNAGAIGFGERILTHFCLGQNHSYQFTPADHPLFLALADVAAARNVPIDVHMEAVPSDMKTPENLRSACAQNPVTLPASIPAFERLLAHNQQTRVVWQHIGWDNLGFMTTDLLRRMLQTHTNLFVSLRVEHREFMVGTMGKTPMPNSIVLAAGNIKPEWLALFREFPERFLIGSDAFVGSHGELTHEPIASFDEKWAMCEKLPESLRQKIGGDNPARVYGL